MAYTKYSLTPADNNAAPPNGAPEGMLPSAVNDTMRDMMSQIRDVGDGIRGGTYTMTAPVITGGSITGVALSGNTLTNPVITGGSINNTTVGATTRSTGAFTTLASNGATTFTAGTASTSTTTGTAVITGGLGVSGRINAANFDGIVGATTPAAGTFTSITDSGNLTFTGTGNRITGDFSNATVASRVLVQTSTTNGSTIFGIIPNGTGTASGFTAVNNSDPTNASLLSLNSLSTEARILATITGTGTFLPMTFWTNGSERMRIDTSGNVGIGTSSPTTKLQVTGTLHLTGAGTFPATGEGLEIVPAVAGGNNFIQAYSRTASAFQILKIGSSVTMFETGGTERMRIDSGGDFLIGTTANVGSGFKTVVSGGGNGIGIATTGGNGTQFCGFFYTSTSIGSISNNSNTGVLYNVTSDYRLKTVIAPVTDAGQRIDALKPIEYSWNTGGNSKGFLAHQFAEVYPNSVTGEKDAVDADGKPAYQSMQASSAEVMADLIAEIQSLRKRVAQLESK